MPLNATALADAAALLTALVSLLVAVLLVRTLHLHGHLSLDSTLGPQRFHAHPTPRVGGIAIVLGLLAGYPLAPPALCALLGPLLLIALPAFLFGLLEDVTKNVPVRVRLLATMACGVLGWAITGYAITDANMPGLDSLLRFTVVSVAFTGFAVGGIANAINIIDGFNGLAAGTLLIILIALGLMCQAVGDWPLVALCGMLGAAVLGFALVNWPLGKIFLGDGGAYFSGVAVAWIAVLLLARHEEVSAWAPLLVCGFPILEVLFSIARRHRRKRSPGDADRMHLHSLVKRRLVRRLLPHASRLTRNSVTGMLMWLVALPPAAIAVRWPTHTPALLAGFGACALAYAVLYARLTQFRWWVKPTLLLFKTP